MRNCCEKTRMGTVLKLYFERRVSELGRMRSLWIFSELDISCSCCFLYEFSELFDRGSFLRVNYSFYDASEKYKSAESTPDNRIKCVRTRLSIHYYLIDTDSKVSFMNIPDLKTMYPHLSIGLFIRRVTCIVRR